MPASSVINVLEYLRSRTQVDLDALDVEGDKTPSLLSIAFTDLRSAAKKGALEVPYMDATSNPVSHSFRKSQPMFHSLT